jgi:Cu-Zn family superoxide dismutase
MIGAGLVTAGRANAGQERVAAVLRDPSGARIGLVTFTGSDRGAVVAAVLRPSRYVSTAAFHGFHVHVNDDARNGTGCAADPASPSSTWFVSADGHYAGSGRTHPGHDGDMPSVLVGSDGAAMLSFTTTRLTPRSVLGRVVILHARPDNFGNVPVGAGSDQYEPVSGAALDKTALTGNAGDRVACGVITRAR